MPIKVTCSNCGGVLHAPDDAGGKRGRCPTCGNILPIPAEATRASAASLPEAPAAKGPQRSPSFGDFAIGPQVGPPPGGASDSDLSPAAARSSIPGLGDAPRADPRKASMPTFADKPEPRRATDPFARKGAAATEGQPSEGTAKAWRRAKAGLGWVSFSVFLFLIPALALPGYVLAEHFTKQSFLTDAEFPVLKLPQSTAIPVLVATVPVLLGLICLLIGRLGFSNVPRRSCAKGPALLAVLATIVVLAGAFGICFPSVAYLYSPAVVNTPDQPLAEGQPRGMRAGDPGMPAAPAPTPSGGPVVDPKGPSADALPLVLFDTADPSGLIQRFGMLIGAVMLVVGEFWFASAIGRVGSALGDGKTAARSTRYLMLLGLAVVVTVGVVGLAPTEFGFGAAAKGVAKDAGDQIVGLWKAQVTPLIEKLGEHKPALKPGVFLLGGLLLGVIYLRMVGATRGAIREWLDRNGA